MDWKAEAERVARAFGLEGKCEFYRRNKHDESRYFRHLVKPYAITFPHPIGETRLRVTYDPNGRHFDLSNGSAWSLMSVGWDVRQYQLPILAFYNFHIAKALFYLDLLTPEIEDALEVSISAHEKLEWILEFEARYGF